jgi:hypothetical protein
MTPNSNHPAPAKFYGFARSRTIYENLAALKPPSNDVASNDAAGVSALADTHPSQSSDAIPNDAANVVAPSEAPPSRRPDAVLAPATADSAPSPAANDAASIVVRSHARPSRRAGSPVRKKSRSRRKTSRARRQIAKAPPEPPRRLSRLELHRAHCGICGDDLQEEIDERFVNWECVSQIAADYEIERSALYRHAHATGLMARRDRNIRRALCHIIQDAGQVAVTADSVVRAVKAFAHINARGEWVNPPTQVVFSSKTARPPTNRGQLSGTPSHLIEAAKP